MQSFVDSLRIFVDRFRGLSSEGHDKNVIYIYIYIFLEVQDLPPVLIVVLANTVYSGVAGTSLTPLVQPVLGAHFAAPFKHWQPLSTATVARCTAFISCITAFSRKALPPS